MQAHATLYRQFSLCVLWFATGKESQTFHFPRFHLPGAMPVIRASLIVLFLNDRCWIWGKKNAGKNKNNSKFAAVLFGQIGWGSWENWLASFERKSKISLAVNISLAGTSLFLISVCLRPCLAVYSHVHRCLSGRGSPTPVLVAPCWSAGQYCMCVIDMAINLVTEVGFPTGQWIIHFGCSPTRYLITCIIYRHK